jgi:acyl-coenzyme A thioesterase PaaI-like protein
MTTVDQTIHLLRPAVNADVLADARVLRLGKTMAFGRVTLLAEGDPRPVGTAQVAYALMGGSTPPNQAPSPAGTSAGRPG